MSGPDLSQISSNWKKLQQQLQQSRKTKDGAQKSKHLKRKASVERAVNLSRLGNRSAINKQRIDGTHAKPRGNRAAMGSGASKVPGPNTSSGNRATTSSDNAPKLIRDHDIAPADVSAAYNLATTAAAAALHDEVNSGLHPTNKAGKYLALDCEMVGTGQAPDYADNILARASLVNFLGQQIYDSYVQPPPGIVVKDYRTHVSGIEPQHLGRNVARPFATVQKTVADLLHGRVLVGHALRNDLAVLLLSHPRRDVRDTSRHAPFRVSTFGKAPALRNLALQELGWTIQSGQHSSIEDARAAMMLYKKDKQAFELENVRSYRRHRRLQGDNAAPKFPKARSSPDWELDGEEEEEGLSHGLEGEHVDADEDDGSHSDEGGKHVNAASKPKKKRKKKKRTKRK